MNKPMCVALLICLAWACQDTSRAVLDVTAMAEGTTLQARIVEASCGECRFGMAGDGCDLAVRADGAVAFVDGTGIDDHGDSHASDGFCNAVRQARVSGTVTGGKLVVTSFELTDG